MNNYKSDGSLKCGKIIGYNNNSGILHILGNGNKQFEPKGNILPRDGLDIFNYSNNKNEKVLLQEMNADGNVGFYKGKKEEIHLNNELEPEPAPPNEPKRGGMTQKKNMLK